MSAKMPLKSGRALPASWTQSEFFSSISQRALGSVGAPDSLLGIRLSSLALHPSGLSMLGLLFIPFVLWRLWHARGWLRVAQGAILAGLCLCLVWSESRSAYVAFSAACVVVLGIEKGWARKAARRPWLVPLVVGVLAVLVIVLLVVYPGWSRIVRVVSDLASAWRPGSWRARLRVYEETLRLIPQHPLAGWGVAVRIPGMRSTFSAGSHSGYLSMLFQHGVVGLALYVGLWFAVWREIVYGLHGRAMPRWLALRFPWLMSAAAMLALNIRELADGWTWDQLVAMTVWTLWGLILVAPRLGVGTGAQTPCPEGAAPVPSAQRTRAQDGKVVDP
jgi:O-antigen ligase